MGAADIALARVRASLKLIEAAVADGDLHRATTRAAPLASAVQSLIRHVDAGRLPAEWRKPSVTSRPVYSLAEIRDGTGWPEGARFELLPGSGPGAVA